MLRFSEEQQFWNWLRYGLLLFTIIGLIVYLSLRPDESPPLFTLTLILLLVPAPIFFWKMKTELDSKHIFIKIKPIINKAVAYETIQSWTIRNYKPLLEYGGWGIRWGLNGTAYNTTGNIGLDMTLTTGKRILVGTLKPDELRRVLRSIIPEKEYPSS